MGWIGTSDHPDGTPAESDLFGNLDLLATLFELVQEMRFSSSEPYLRSRNQPKNLQISRKM
jgi:hypothetical protein